MLKTHSRLHVSPVPPPPAASCPSTSALVLRIQELEEKVGLGEDLIRGLLDSSAEQLAFSDIVERARLRRRSGGST
jgi:hypothetical protein